VANWSDTYIKLIGPKKSISKAWKFISRFLDNSNTDDTNYKYGGLNTSILKRNNNITSRLGYSYLDIFEIDMSNAYTIIIEGSGKWQAPYLFFQNVAEEFALSLKYDDAECGCDFYQQIRMNRGEIVENTEYPYHSIQRYKSKLVNDPYCELDWYWDQECKECINEDIEEIIDELQLKRPTNSKLYSLNQ
jgi:hypothetical protein